MDLEQVLKDMDQEEMQKIASDKTPQKEESLLAAALEKAAAAPPQASGSDDVVADLMKLANEVAGTEREMELSHANLVGQAFADGAINKFAAYDAQVKAALAQEAVAYSNRIATTTDSANNGQAKVAADSADKELVKAAAEAGYQATMEKIALESLSEKDLVKMAAEAGYQNMQEKLAQPTDKDLVKAAAEAGYRDMVEKLSGTSQSQYQDGYNQALDEVHKVASAEFIKGAAEAEIMLNQARQ